MEGRREERDWDIAGEGIVLFEVSECRWTLRIDLGCDVGSYH